MNHAETDMRKGEWPEATPVSGIEAVGTVAADPSGALAEGTKVLAIMGGLGVDKVQAGVYHAKPARVFAFEEIAEAHRVMEASQAAGKLVVRTS